MSDWTVLSIAHTVTISSWLMEKHTSCCLPVLKQKISKQMKLQIMELGEPDASGRRKPVVVEGSNHVVPVDMVIMSIGTKLNTLILDTTENLEANEKGGIGTDEGAATNSKFMKITDWAEPSEISFEGHLFNAPKNSDPVLTMWYGDYMKLPPEDQRHSHEYYKMYWR